MKSAICLVVGAVFCGVSCLAQSSAGTENESSAQANPGYTITLTQPTSSISVGSRIMVPMTIRNITKGDIFWNAVWSTDKDSWHSGFRFLLTKDGKEVETTFHHRIISGRQRPGDPSEVDSGSTILLPKPPGIMFEMTIDLKRLYEITEPGKYVFKVTRTAEDNKTIVHSNTVILNIVP
jgi:hypothetical protein